MADDSSATDDTQLATQTAAPSGTSSDAEPLQPGDFLGRYKVVSRLGAGGMGIVYRARDTDLNRDIAIKLLQPTEDGSQPADVLQQRLLREAQAMAQLSHPNLVSVYDVGKSGAQVFVAMEFVDGMTLKEYMRDRTRTWEQRLNAVLDAARGLIEAHDAGVIHRDFKPDNVFVSKSGRVQVGDFGLARSMMAFEPTVPPSHDDPSAPMLDSLTRTGTIMGTPAYMSPEQHAGKVADARSDQFSLGVTMFEALYGYRPYTGTDARALANAINSDQVEPPPADSPVPPPVHTALTRSLRADPQARFPTVAAFVAALETATTTDVAPGRRPAWLVPAVALASVAIVAATVVALRQNQRPPRAPEPAAAPPTPPPAPNPDGHDYRGDGASALAAFTDKQRLNLTGCFRLAWRSDPLAAGVIKLSLRIDANGRAQRKAMTLQPASLSSEAADCVARTARRHPWPAPKRPPATLKLPIRMTPPPTAGITKVMATTYKVRRGVLHRFKNEPTLSGSGGRLVPSIRKGKPFGLKIYAINRDSVYRALGLNNGDTVVRANDMSLASPNLLLAAYNALLTANKITLHIIRRGVGIDLVYDIVD